MNKNPFYFSRKAKRYAEAHRPPAANRLAAAKDALQTQRVPQRQPWHGALLGAAFLFGGYGLGFGGAWQLRRTQLRRRRNLWQIVCLAKVF